MNYSGVLVSAFPGRYDEMLRELDTIEGVEVVSTLSGVADAALVVHNFEDDAVVCSSNT